jgi:hypothetical protein
LVNQNPGPLEFQTDPLPFFHLSDMGTDGVMIGHSFLAEGVAPVPGEVKAAASRHRAKRGFGLEFPWDWGKMTSKR